MVPPNLSVANAIARLSLGAGDGIGPGFGGVAKGWERMAWVLRGCQQ